MDRQVRLTIPRPDGSCLAEHCQAVEDQTGQWPEDNPLPEVPSERSQIWNWYWEIRRAIPAGFSGPQPIPYSEIFAWQSLTQRNIGPSDIYYFNLLDSAYLSSHNKYRTR